MNEKNVIYIYMGYYSAIKKTMSVMLSEINQMEKDKYFLTYVEYEKKTTHKKRGYRYREQVVARGSEWVEGKWNG